MILDKDNIFSDGQAVTATVGATQVLDLGPGDLGTAEAISLFVNINPAFTGNGTLEVELKTADTLASDGTLGTVTTSTVAIYPLTNGVLLGGGPVVAARVPQGLKRYCTLNYQVTGTLVGGKITAGLALDI